MIHNFSQFFNGQNFRTFSFYKIVEFFLVLKSFQNLFFYDKKILEFSLVLNKFWKIHHLFSVLVYPLLPTPVPSLLLSTALVEVQSWNDKTLPCIFAPPPLFFCDIFLEKPHPYIPLCPRTWYWWSWKILRKISWKYFTIFPSFSFDKIFDFFPCDEKFQSTPINWCTVCDKFTFINFFKFLYSSFSQSQSNPL